MNKSKFVVRDIVEIAMLVAIAVVLDLDFLKFTVFPAGGSVGLTMVPLFILAFRHGVVKSFFGIGIVYSLITCMLDGHGWACFPFDYVLAYGSICLAGFFKPLIFKAELKEKKDYAILLHHDTNRSILNSITPVTNNYKELIDYIYNSKLVISSSLHGIILAETYGIPAILLTDRETSNRFKYNDYYYSTERFDYPVAQSIEEALALQPAHLPNLTDIRKNILNSFPYDLWN